MDRPFWVQAYRPGQFHVWCTDSRHATVEAAIAAAMVLVEQWGRKVRVIDQAEQVYFFHPLPQKTPRRR